MNRALYMIGEPTGARNGSAIVEVRHLMKETVSVRYGDSRVLQFPLAEIIGNQQSNN